MAEGAALEMPCTLSGYRGFESPSLRHFPRGMRIPGFDCEALGSRRRTCASWFSTNWSGSRRRMTVSRLRAARRDDNVSLRPAYGRYLACPTIQRQTVDRITSKFDINNLEGLPNEIGIAQSTRHLTNRQANEISTFGSIDSLRNRLSAAAQARDVQGLQ